MMSLKRLRKHSGDVSECKYPKSASSPAITVYLQKGLSLKRQHKAELENKFPGMICGFSWLQKIVWRLQNLGFSSAGSKKFEKCNKIIICMKSDEVDQIVAPPHPSRTATRCPKCASRTAKISGGILDILHASRTAEDSQAHLRVPRRAHSINT
ncbi:hypothetical protein E3N88_14203 [Mikania micrantha]|uniref:Uncharacterized protein n=1 Tax=Mikania micrantha TaxID=192012 RepID=A0A5N6P2T2_9ASTR|nr:hypothetical protein E3N88_14203 [Mikania micrantha]